MQSAVIWAGGGERGDEIVLQLVGIVRDVGHNAKLAEIV